ncbi:hypothetical protein IQ264_11400 [Phormidium sp. LEGE 05292]|uniref:hypothetical protein n=1 Tax=[Phormidium] sp. LEGE 05292 TaxID=767427 RepID=UPI0018813C43|nr:hypothetical protein [Phormidium sp. LEGE 05292]MBE9226030.1 hypothetical protein [Phormidium sp. LEGE 05292]
MKTLKTILGSAAIAAIALIVTHPLVAEAIPQRARNACIRSTAEEMGVPVGNIVITNVGPVSAESGAATLMMENNKTGQTAECRVNTIDGTILSVNVGNGNAAAEQPEFFVVTASRTFIKASPGVLSHTVANNIRSGTVLRNLGCKRETQTPTWCQVELRDDPQIKGWVWSPDISEYQADSSSSTTDAAPGNPVSALEDLVGARAGQAEQTLQQRGYEWRNTKQLADSSFSYWLEQNTGNCVAVRTTNGRYRAIVYTTDRDCNRR